MKPPAFQFYPDDFVGGTVALTTKETGAYILLICYQWGNGKIPEEKTAIDRVAGCVVSSHVLAKFPGGKNKRLEQERRKQSEYREKQRLAGIASGKSRAIHRSTTVQPLFNQPLNQTPTNTPTKTNSPSPSPFPYSIKTNTGNGDSVDLFDQIANRIGKMFNRPVTDRGDGEEVRYIADVCRRPNVMNELGEIESFQQKEQKFFPRSVKRVVGNWQSILDSARVWKPNRTPEEERRMKNLIAQWT